MAWSRRVVVAVAALGAACSSAYSEHSPASTSPGTDAGQEAASDAAADGGDAGGPLPDCRAQRVVHLVGGMGGLASFTLLWPNPAVIDNFAPAYAYDNPEMAISVGAPSGGSGANAHPLYARKLSDGSALLSKRGKAPHPTAFVTTGNQTHTRTPITTRLPDTAGAAGRDVLVTGAIAQMALASAIPVLALSGSAAGGGPPLPSTYVPDGGAPPLFAASSVEEVISALKMRAPISPALEQELRPSPAELSTWVTLAASAPERDLAERLLFTANLLRRGLVGTVFVNALEDDPHGLFTDVTVAAARADGLARILDAFYAKLATADEAACGSGGARLSVADNVVLVVSGDTPKNSFTRSGWPDGTPNATNYLYVRSNGFLAPGWFGAVSPGAGHQRFDPSTGELQPGGTTTTGDEAAPLLALLHAIVRGDATSVKLISTLPYEGVVSKTPP